MLIKIHKNRSVSSSGTWGTKNENNYEILDFEFPEELEEYNKRIVYYLGSQKVWDPIIDNKVILTNAITTKESVKAYIWCTKTDAQYETDVDFRTQLFEMNFFENENADGIVPTEEQIDGFNTMLTAMNEKIEEIDELETTIKNAETQRQENEETRQNNEKTRQENEQTRQNQEAERERRTDKAIEDIKDKTTEYNQNAQEKTESFNTNASQKTNDFNSNYTQKVNEFNSNVSSKTNDFNSNAETKTNAFNTNATNKTNDFNSNATEKTTTFDNNATEKTNEFNTNTQNKINEYDEHIADYQAQIDELQEEVEELSENMPWNTTEQATEISVDDAAKYSRNKLELFGNTYQLSLPSGYTRLEYIECTGTQYINLDYVIKSNTKLEIEYQTEKLRSNTLFGASNNYINYYASGLAGGTAQTGQDYPTTIKVSTDLSTEKTSLLWERAQVTYNGNIVTGNFGLDDSSLVLFKNRRWPNDLGKVKLYKFIAYDRDIIAANYIPCKNGNNEVGLYDVVSNTFYGNSGTGDLVAGTDLGTLPSQDYPQDIHVFKGSNIIHTENKDYPIDIPDGIEMHRIGDYAYEIFKNERSNIYYDASLIEDRWYYRYRIRTFKLIPGVFSQIRTNANYTVYQTRHFENLYDGRYKGKTTYCTHFTGGEANYVYDISTNNSYNICGVADQNKLRIKVKTADFPTVSDFNSFLENNNVEFVSISATPIITLIEDETFVAQVEKIYKHLKLIKGTNNITVTAEDLAPYMKLTYIQDLPSRLDKLEAMVIDNS